MLVTLRIAQAAAGATLMPNGMAMLRTHAPPEQLGRLNGINGRALGRQRPSGPLVGAAVLAVASWRWLFPISVPFILLALFLLQRLHVRGSERLARTSVDWIGTALFVGAAGRRLTLQLGSLRERTGAVEASLRWGGSRWLRRSSSGASGRTRRRRPSGGSSA